MPLNLGSSAVSLYLGDQPVNAYLGETLLTAPLARTLYFTGAVNADWSELGNWFDDAGGVVFASSLPTAVDSVIATASIIFNGGDPVELVNFTLNDPDVNYHTLDISITVTGMATFNDSSGNYGTVTGDATFNDNSQNYGTVTGDATFNDSAFNVGNVTGTATFVGSSCNDGGEAGAFDPDPPPTCSV